MVTAALKRSYPGAVAAGDASRLTRWATSASAPERLRASRRRVAL
jgi:hypothetical protein